MIEGGVCQRSCRLVADFAMPLLASERQKNISFETFIFLLICEK